MLEVLKPPFPVNKPVILHKQPIQQDNYLSTPKTSKKSPEKLINKISPKTLEKFSLNYANKKTDQPKTSQPLALTANNKEEPTEKEQILLQKIKLLERQLAQVQAENNNLKSKNKHLKALVQQNQAQIIQLPLK